MQLFSDMEVKCKVRLWGYAQDKTPASLIGMWASPVKWAIGGFWANWNRWFYTTHCSENTAQE